MLKFKMSRLVLVMLLLQMVSFSVVAQITQDCDGNVNLSGVLSVEKADGSDPAYSIVNGNFGVGQFWGGTPRRLFDVNGHSYFSCLPAQCGFYFEDYNYRPILRPQWTNTMYIGKYDRYIYRIYSTYIHANTIYTTSDENIKENITNLHTSLDSIMRIRPAKFDYKASYFSDSLGNLNSELEANRINNIGFIAQEVKEVFPELVKFNEESELYEINYIGFIPELVKAIQELTNRVKVLENHLLSESNSNKNATLDNVNGSENNSSDNGDAYLLQNAPNPFSLQTEISFYIPENASNAMIIVHDMQGTEKKQYPITNVGSGTIIINGYEFTAGLYTYSLVVDGVLIDTKKMLLTSN